VLCRSIEANRAVPSASRFLALRLARPAMAKKGEAGNVLL
jgi:hypothetical protein